MGRPGKNDYKRIHIMIPSTTWAKIDEEAKASYNNNKSDVINEAISNWFHPQKNFCNIYGRFLGFEGSPLITDIIQEENSEKVILLLYDYIKKKHITTEEQKFINDILKENSEVDILLNIKQPTLSTSITANKATLSIKKFLQTILLLNNVYPIEEHIGICRSCGQLFFKTRQNQIYHNEFCKHNSNVKHSKASDKFLDNIWNYVFNDKDDPVSQIYRLNYKNFISNDSNWSKFCKNFWGKIFKSQNDSFREHKNLCVAVVMQILEKLISIDDNIILNEVNLSIYLAKKIIPLIPQKADELSDQCLSTLEQNSDELSKESPESKVKPDGVLIYVPRNTFKNALSKAFITNLQAYIDTRKQWLASSNKNITDLIEKTHELMNSFKKEFMVIPAYIKEGIALRLELLTLKMLLEYKPDDNKNLAYISSRLENILAEHNSCRDALYLDMLINDIKYEKRVFNSNRLEISDNDSYKKFINEIKIYQDSIFSNYKKLEKIKNFIETNKNQFIQKDLSYASRIWQKKMLAIKTKTKTEEEKVQLGNEIKDIISHELVEETQINIDYSTKAYFLDEDIIKILYMVAAYYVGSDDDIKILSHWTQVKFIKPDVIAKEEILYLKRYTELGLITQIYNDANFGLKLIKKYAPELFEPYQKLYNNLAPKAD